MEGHSSQSSVETEPERLLPDLSSIPPISVLQAHFKDDEHLQLEEKLREYGAPVTADLSRVKVFIGKVGTKRRAEFELRSRKFKFEEVNESAVITEPPPKEPGLSHKRKKGAGSSSKPINVDDDGSTTEEEKMHPVKKRKVDISLQRPVSPDLEGSTTEEETDNEKASDPETEDKKEEATDRTERDKEDRIDQEMAIAQQIFKHEVDTIWIININWFDRCVAAGHILPLADDLVYKIRVLQRPAKSPPPAPSQMPSSSLSRSRTAAMSVHRTKMAAPPPLVRSILERAKADMAHALPPSRYVPNRQGGHGSQRFEGMAFSSSTQQAGNTASQTAQLLQQTTSEYEGTDSDIPEPPEWVKKGVKYACQRFTPANGPNEEFISLLQRIRLSRTLIDDDVGVRAYSTSIASIAAYPHKFSHPRELVRLPGCDTKIANLWVEYKNTNTLKAVEEFEHDEAMKVLRTFYEIWGVGAKTARNFYYRNHWTELDDIIEYGWDELDRVQQIGLKYYEEFLQGIPRDEVERIADVVREHAVKLRDHRITVTIVGGYRRGKELSGDVDIVVSHPDLEATAGLVQEITDSLEDAEWITHTLTISLNNTNRGQHTLPFRTSKQSGAGFDTLDKALVVWQDPDWPTREQDVAANPRAKNPNVHRRVDIIIAPWRTVGCAVMGWSGGTTFQRDLRRYAKHMKGWKFDSSGIRSRETGEVVEAEGPNGVLGTPEDAEKRVFEALGLEFVPPNMRCTN